MNGTGFRTLEFQIQRHSRKASEIRKKVKSVRAAIANVETRLDGLEDLVVELENITADCLRSTLSVESAATEKLNHLRNFNVKKDGSESVRLQRIIDQQKIELSLLRSKEQEKADNLAKADTSEIQKASTICILDTILFAIENWTTDGQTAPDVTLASQSVLFSVVYDKVMSGDSDYYLDKFPVISMEVIRRGREFVKYIREDSPVALTTEDVWNKYAPQLQEWWINDALPLIFGARDDGWIDEEVYTYEEMIKWRDMPQSRLLDFPKVSDGMDLVARHMDNIREQIGLRDFNLQQIQTRFNHE